MDGWTDGLTDGWMDGWMDGASKYRCEKVGMKSIFELDLVNELEKHHHHHHHRRPCFPSVQSIYLFDEGPLNSRDDLDLVITRASLFFECLTCESDLKALSVT